MERRSTWLVATFAALILSGAPAGAQPAEGVHFSLGSVAFELGGQVRLRFEDDNAFDGYCNLFFWANLWDREVQLLLRPAGRLDVHLQAHSFALASPRDAWYSTSLSVVRRDPSGASGTDLGDEIDLRAVFRIHPRVELMAGLGYYRPGTFVRRTGAARDALWRMVQATWSW